IPSEIVSPQGKFDCRLQKTQLVAGIVAGAVEHVGIYGLLFEKHANAIGELDFITASHASFVEDAENLRRQNVPSDDRHVRGSFVGRRLFYHILYAKYAAIEAIDWNAADHPIVLNFRMRNFACRDDRRLQLFKQIDHLFHAWNL